MTRRLAWTTPLNAIAGIALVAALTAFASPRPAREGFHLRLVRADPAIDSTVAMFQPTIRLWFSEKVNLKATAVTITGATGAAVALGPVTVDTLPQAPVTAQILAPMAPGKYTVNWRAMGRDSHIVKDSFAFTVAAPLRSPAP